MKSSNVATPMVDYHYFASTAFSWATAPTAQEAIDIVANNSMVKTICARKKDNTVMVGVCRVETSATAEYEINHHTPVGVPISKPQHYDIVSHKGYIRLIDPAA